MPLVVGISLRKTKDFFWFDAGELDIAVGEGVLVETENGVEVGIAAKSERMIETKEQVRKVIRKLNPEDRERIGENLKKSQESHRVVLQKISDSELIMKLTAVEYTYDRTKLFIYYTAEERVDFRELIKDLGFMLKTRIHMVQIGVRDEAKMLGGFGPCGKILCCCQFLKEFKSVSIDTAKEQDIPINPSKISGVCGRLMCCIGYEYEYYLEAKKKLPAVESTIHTPNGDGKVKSVNAIKLEVTVGYEDGTVKTFKASELKK